MADITKCQGTGCIVKDSCFRYTYTAPDGEMQSYFAEPPLKASQQHDGMTCEYYWKNEA